MQTTIYTAHYLLPNGHAACGCTKERKRSRKAGATAIELTSDPTLVGCASCERTKAHRVALAKAVEEREAKRAEQREAAKVRPIVIAIAEVKGITPEEAADLPATAISSDEMTAAIAKLATA